MSFLVFLYNHFWETICFLLVVGFVLANVVAVIRGKSSE